MKNLLALAAALVLTFVVVGYFLGWYHVSETDTPTGRHYDIDVNSPKITEDLNKGKEKLKEVLSKKEKDPVNPAAKIPPLPENVVPGGVPTSFPAAQDDGIGFSGIEIPPLPPAPPTPPSVPVPPLPKTK